MANLETLLRGFRWAVGSLIVTLAIINHGNAQTVGQPLIYDPPNLTTDPAGTIVDAYVHSPNNDICASIADSWTFALGQPHVTSATIDARADGPPWRVRARIGRKLWYSRALVAGGQRCFTENAKSNASSTHSEKKTHSRSS